LLLVLRRWLRASCDFETIGLVQIPSHMPRAIRRGH
jgi:uncharacterized SAM-binding protein YcdF (DUF218 family)